jgi:hypothetical protein
MRLDVVRLVAFAMALRGGTGELLSVWKDDLLASLCLYEAMVYRLCHGCWSWVFAFNNVLARRLLECPYYWLWGLHTLRYRVHAITVNRYDNEVMLLLRLLWNGQAEDLVDIFPCNAELDVTAGAYCAYATIVLVEEL